MEINEVIALAEQNIRQAIKDYGAHTSQTKVLDDISDSFVHRLAEDSTKAKWELRELFRKSPAWNEELSAIIINGTRTHNPDYYRIGDLAWTILSPARIMNDSINTDTLIKVCKFFSESADTHAQERGIEAIKALAPKAYAPNKKLSRVFKAVCTALGVADETAGSDFQRLYAQFADELTAKKISFKLYVSINPAHFLTMSNPKCDDRGCTLTSCHSFNSTDYEYNNGCTGYARDNNTFIVFTVSDPNDPETFNNRKTTRQIFAYKPGNGLLIQSRLYNTSGGTHGAQEESKLYRDLVQREISMLENTPNLWKTHSTYNSGDAYAYTGNGFGGYADWTYEDFDGKASIRTDHAGDYEAVEIGTFGLCVKCACDMSYGLYCSDCREDDDNDDSSTCDYCGEYFSDSDLYPVLTSGRDREYVCEDCRDEYYSQCSCCEEYYRNENLTEVHDGSWICPTCLERHYTMCDYCEEYYEDDDMCEVKNEYGYDVYVCEDCRDSYYTRCNDCGEVFYSENVETITLDTGEVIAVCENCKKKHDAETELEMEVEAV